MNISAPGVRGDADQGAAKRPSRYACCHGLHRPGARKRRADLGEPELNAGHPDARLGVALAFRKFVYNPLIIKSKVELGEVYTSKSDCVRVHSQYFDEIVFSASA